MTPIEATDLAVRITKSWTRSSIPTSEWEDELADLDAGRAGTAFVRLRRRLTHAPSIAEFHTEYAATNTSDASTRPTYAACAHCESTGWKPLTTTHDTPDGPIELQNSVQPCHCAWGDSRRHTHTTVVNGNTAELDRIFPQRHDARTSRSAA